MAKLNIALIGLGRIGSAFLNKMLARKGDGINIAYAAEIANTPGKAQAAAAGIRIVSVNDIVALGEKVDVIFELTGLPEVRKELREKLTAANNRHTVIAPETIVRVIWALISDDALPLIEGRKTGY